jgi:peptide/nickel transport system substrate-binding protein
VNVHLTIRITTVDEARPLDGNDDATITQLLEGVTMTEDRNGSDGVEQEDGRSTGFGLSRRHLLQGTGGAAMLAALAACGGGGGSTNPSSTGGASGTPKPGGDFTLGVTGGGTKDIMDGQNIVTKPDQARLVSAFETLLTFDENYQLTTDGLAESVTADNPKQYTIKLHKGIEFQNGKTLTADDVIYSL